MAFDLATKTGWAHATAQAIGNWPGDVPGKKGPVDGVTYGDFSCGPGQPHPRRWLMMKERVTDLLVKYNPKLVVFEAPLPAIKGRATGTAKLLIGFATIVEMLAYDRGSVAFEEYPSTVKKWATGNGRAEKSDMLNAACQRGWDPDNDDEADALMLLDMAIYLRVALKPG